MVHLNKQKRREVRRPRYFLNIESVREEMELFMEEWRKEKNSHGVYVPARYLYNTTATLNELVERGLLHTGVYDEDTAGYAPC